jgi:hypothetical protein
MRLLIRVNDQTERGLLHWSHGSHQTEFNTSLKKGALVVSSRDQDGVAPFQFSVVTGDGVVADSWTTSGDGSDGDQLIYAIYAGARRSASGSREVVDELLSELDDNEPF